jgi:hypothetical protein
MVGRTSTWPSLRVTVKVTARLATGVPLDESNWTTSGCASTVAACALWLLPLNTESES